jgi:hypothetical protein
MTMPSDPELQRAFADLQEVDTREGRERCVPPEAIFAVVERSGSEATRLESLDHVMACSACRQELELLRAIARIRPRGRKFLRLPAHLTPVRLASVASLVFALGAASLWWGGLRPGSEPVMRGDDEKIQLVSPESGAGLQEGVTFTWRSLPGSFDYTLEIFDGGGGVLLSTSTRDTTFTLRGALPEGGDGNIRWWVTARMGNGSMTSSEIRPLEPALR